MNVTPSKILLLVSLGALTYGSWDHLFTSKAEAPAPAKTRELTAAMVNRSVVLTLVRVVGSDGYFTYAIDSVTDTTFSVTATRSGSGAWSGTLTITQDGEVTGNVNNGSAVLTPPDL